jgi:5,10-methylenetetrahydrofolate reductase
MKTYQEINDRIASGKAVVMTAEEIIDYVDPQGLDAAATHAANLVKSPDDIQAALGQIAGIEGIDGVLLVRGDRIGMAGDLPPLVRNRDAELGQKVTRDPDSR